MLAYNHVYEFTTTKHNTLDCADSEVCGFEDYVRQGRDCADSEVYGFEDYVRQCTQSQIRF